MAFAQVDPASTGRVGHGERAGGVLTLIASAVINDVEACVPEAEDAREHLAETIPDTSAAERAVADLLPIDAPPAVAERARDAVPVWFHTFALAPGVYTPGLARDHRSRPQVLGADRLRGRSVLDIGTFDGFYAFLAEARGARRVVAVDNEQYVDWIRGRFGIELDPAAGFETVHHLLRSNVEYRTLDALAVGQLNERFDVVLCFGMLHRVSDPVAILRALADVLEPGGEVILETYGSALDDDTPAIEIHQSGGVYAGDDFVYWGFPSEGLRRLARLAGLDSVKIVAQVAVDGHPRILAVLRSGA
jgi:tRNA (mo5U34)-methyltransferase